MEKSTRPERRLNDRRSQPTHPLSISSFKGKRKQLRREEDNFNQPYVDIYSLRSVLVIVLILIFSVTDAVFTLKLIRIGGRELNPVMDFLLSLGALPFLLIKYLMTGSCLVLFLVHKNRKVFAGRVGVKALIISVLFLYSLLILYELILLF